MGALSGAASLDLLQHDRITKARAIGLHRTPIQSGEPLAADDGRTPSRFERSLVHLAIPPLEGPDRLLNTVSQMAVAV